MRKPDKEAVEKRRRQILAAANRCFARDGFHNATTDDIAREAGLSSGAMYNYFGGKDDLIAALAETRHRIEAEVCERAEDIADPYAALAYMTQAFFWHVTDPAQDEERRVGVQFWAEALNNERLLKVSLEGQAAPLRTLTTLIDALKKAGEIPPGIETEALARVMVALFQGFVLQKCREPDMDAANFSRAALYLWERMQDGPRAERGPGDSSR